MSAQRFHGKSSRAVLKEVRAILGEDAVIISNRTANGAVEILAMAAADMDTLVESVDGTSVPATRTPEARPMAVTRTTDLETFDQYLQRAGGAANTGRSHNQSAPAARPARVAAAYESVFSSRLDDPEPVADRGGAFDNRPIVQEKVVRRAENPSKGASEVNEYAAPPAPEVRQAPPPLADDSRTVQAAVKGYAPDLMAEMRSMKDLLHDQLSQIAWSESVRRQPLRAKILAKLLQCGFSPLLSRTLLEKMPSGMGEEVAAAWLSQVLNQNLKICAPGEGMIDAGGVFALVGPTGVGKTTTTAKLAARAVMRYGAKSVGLITVDHYRIGAHEQLRTFGKMLGCPVHIAHDASTLNDLLAGMRGRRLVLIDTVGLPQRDPRLNEHLSMLMGSGIERVMVLNSASQIETLEEVVASWRGPRCHRAIVSKIDEAVKLAGVVDVAIRNRLLLDCIANGQRVPEDLHAANAGLLVHRALRAPSQTPFRLKEEELNLMAVVPSVREQVRAA